ECGQFLALAQTVLRSAQILQRGGQFARACFYAFKQPYVFNRNYCLVSESGNQCDVIGIKRSNSRTRQYDDADWDPFPQKRNTKRRPISATPLSFKECIFWISKNVWDMDGTSFERRTCCDRPTTWSDRLLFQIVYPFGYVTAASSTTINITIS